MRVQQVPNSPILSITTMIAFSVYPKTKTAKSLSQNLKRNHSSMQ